MRPTLQQLRSNRSCSATAVLARRRLLPGPATAPCELLPAPPCNLLPAPPAGLTARARGAAGAECLCSAGYGGTLVSGGSDATNGCELCPVNQYSPAAEAGGCVACPANSNTGGLRGTASRADCRCGPQFTGDLGVADASCEACEAGKYKDSSGAMACAPIVDCEGYWSEWTSGADLCLGGVDAAGASHNNEESRTYTVVQPYHTPNHGAACAAADGAVETRTADATRFAGDRWLTVDVTEEQRDLPDGAGGTAAARVVVVTVASIAHNAATSDDGMVDGKNVGIDLPRVAIDGVDVQVQTANNMAFQAERAVAAGGSSPLVSISALRSCAGAEGHASHEFSGLGHFRLFLPADGTAAAPGLY